MKRKFILSIIIFLSLFVTCSRILETEDNKFTVSGKVKHFFTEQGLDSAKVVIVASSFENISYSDNGGISLNADMEQKSTLTDSSGNFEIKTEIEETKDIYIVVSKHSFQDTAITVEGAEPGGKQSVGTIKLIPDYKPITISGQLLNNFNNKPIANGEVITDLFTEPFITNEQGKFEFDVKIPYAGYTSFIFEKQYFQSDTIEAYLEPEENLDLGNIYLEYIYDQAEITGRVIDKRTGDGLESAKVLLVGTDQFTTTENEGDFTFELQINTPQSIDLQFSKINYTTENKTIDLITPEENLDLKNISLTPPEMDPITITGTVKDEASNDPINALVTIQEYPQLSQSTDESGYFSITIEQPDNYSDTLNIDISPNNTAYNDTTLEQITVASGEGRNLQISLQRKTEFKELIGIRGTVIDQFGNSVENAIVSIQEYPKMQAITNSNGEFQFKDSLYITEAKMLHVNVRKNTYFNTELTKKVEPQQTVINLQDLVIEKRLPAGITFMGHEPKTIRVAKTGGNEYTKLNFQVKDKNGENYDISGEAKIKFEILSNTLPDTARLSKYSTETNSEGIANTVLWSGKKAGDIQLKASIEYPYKNQNIYKETTPVVLTIHGGFPVAENFNVFPETKNIPGLKTAGVEDKITAYAGDKWGNAVKEGTAIWFTTDWSKKTDTDKELGYIMTTDESGLTDNFGRATTTLISSPSNVFPAKPEEGLYTIYAHTTNSEGEEVVDSTTVLFTGYPRLIFEDNELNYKPSITISHRINDLSHPSSVTLTFYLTDEFNNPLGPGTKATASIPNEGVEISVDTDLPDDGLDDTKITGEDPLTPDNLANYSPADNYCTFHITIGTPKPIIRDGVTEYPTGSTSTTISVTSPNGNISKTINVNVVE